MALYGVSPIDDSAKRKKPYDFFQPAKAQAPSPENHYNLLPAAKEPVAASAIVPTGSTYAVVPVGPSPNQETSQQPSYDDPALEYLRKSLDTLKATNDAPVKKESRLKAALKMAGAALGSVPGGTTWTDVARQAGAAAGGAISGAVQPKLPGAVQKLYDVHKAEDDVTRAEKYANVASNITRRASLTDQGDKRLKLAADKQRLDQEWRSFQVDAKNRGLTLAEKKEKFYEDATKRGLTDRETMDEWRKDIGERKFREDRRQFDAQQHIREKNSELNARRTAAYEKSVENGGSKTEAKAASDAAEAEALSDSADEYEGIIATLDPDLDSSEIAKLKGAAVTARTQAKRLGARAGARGEATPMTTGPNKGVTVDAIKKMSEPQFRNYLKTAVPPYSPAETERRVKHWKTLSGK